MCVGIRVHVHSFTFALRVKEHVRSSQHVERSKHMFRKVITPKRIVLQPPCAQCSAGLLVLQVNLGMMLDRTVHVLRLAQQLQLGATVMYLGVLACEAQLLQQYKLVGVGCHKCGRQIRRLDWQCKWACSGSANMGRFGQTPGRLQGQTRVDHKPMGCTPPLQWTELAWSMIHEGRLVNRLCLWRKPVVS